MSISKETELLIDKAVGNSNTIQSNGLSASVDLSLKDIATCMLNKGLEKGVK
jgi:hypothetical protein